MKRLSIGMEMDVVKLNMLYKHTFDHVLPDAYERLLYDVLRGDRSLFIQDDELAVSWDIVTPVLHELENKRIQPKTYPYGSHFHPNPRCLMLSMSVWRMNLPHHPLIIAQRESC